MGSKPDNFKKVSHDLEKNDVLYEGPN